MQRNVENGSQGIKLGLSLSYRPVVSCYNTTNSSRIGAKLITENKSAEKKTWNGIGSEARTSNATLEPIHKEPRNTHLNSVQ
jgi:hypothetical protein